MNKRKILGILIIAIINLVLVSCKSLFDYGNNYLKIYIGSMETKEFNSLFKTDLDNGDSIKLNLSKSELDTIVKNSKYYRDETEVSVRLYLEMDLDGFESEEAAENEAKQLANWLWQHEQALVAVREYNLVYFYARD